ncbi:hypothetical protein TSUD_349920 [Trifolium subterraneum]|uniref:Neurochondrin n=1 Tax=Trifolium subterraneum TaxID=3900 RepID=A0A2Z6ND39_TRISU|nr:hypothetical protein TSUD_349920 [Trifolium subterraneum]
MESQQPEQTLNLDECLKLLSGQRDEQRLAGLLLVTNFCKPEDHSSLYKVYNAIGSRFLHRLLTTATISSSHNKDAYLTLSVTVLATLCRVPVIASSEDMISNIPLMLEVFSMSSSSVPSSVLEECCEFLFLVLSASEHGIMTFYEFGGIKILASRLSALQDDDSCLVDMCIRLLQLIISRISLDTIKKDYLFELSIIVVEVARQFAILHNLLKFEALHILNSVICSTDSSELVETLEDSNWSHDIRVGIVAILQNRVAAAERFRALILAESMVSIFGEDWLIVDQVSNTNDTCLLLVLEQSRVEIAVLLNDLAYLKYEAPQESLATTEAYSRKQRNVAVAYSLVENIINLISNVGKNCMTDLLDEGTLTTLILQLNETITVVLEYLEDAKEHGQRKGDDLLASVRIIGCYIAEAPLACSEKVGELLGYMLSIEGADEQIPFQSICFLLPMLSEITMKVEGCKALASCEGGFKAVLDCFRRLIGSKYCIIEEDICVFLACDTIMNLLLNKDKLLDESAFVDLLKVLAYWSENTNDMLSMMVASSICSLIFVYTSEEALLNQPNFNDDTLSSLYQVIARCMASTEHDTNTDTIHMNLSEIIYAGFYQWAHRYPRIREAIKI